MRSHVVVASSAVPPPERPRPLPCNPNARPQIPPILQEKDLDRDRRALLAAAFSAFVAAGLDDLRASSSLAATTSTSTTSTSTLSPPPAPKGWSYSSKGKDWSSLGFESCGIAGQQSPINISPPFTRIVGRSDGAAAQERQHRQQPFLELLADYRSASFDAVVEQGLTASPKFTVVVGNKEKGGQRGKQEQEQEHREQRRHPAGGIYLLNNDGGNDEERAFYPLVQFHFHRPGEEALEGKRGVLGAHLVHQRDDDDEASASSSGSSPSPNLPRFVVVAVAFDLSRGGRDPPDAALDDLLVEDEGKREEGSPWRRIESFDPSRLLPSSSTLSTSSSSPAKKLKNFFAFEGSLTTPPCTKGARFYFAKGRKKATAEQVSRAVLPRGAENARPLQDRGGRVVWEG